MSFIHLDAEWPRFRWDHEALLEPLALVRWKQGRHGGILDGISGVLRSEVTRDALTEDAVQSWAIEGVELEAERVRSSIARRLGQRARGLPAPSRRSEGVADVMVDAATRSSDALNSERLHRWHRALFQDAPPTLEPLAIGRWRPASSDPMQVVSGVLGRERVHFEAPEASRIPIEMERFFAWFESTRPIDPVLHAAIAHLWFVTNHPYEDGNGRIARAISDLALSRGEGLATRIYSLSAQIKAERSDYYDQLETAQRGSLDISGWLLWFVGCLGRSVQRASSAALDWAAKGRLRDQLNLGSTNSRQRKVVERLLGGFQGPLTTSKYAKMCKCSHDSALRDIQDLVQKGVLVKNLEGGRSTSYRIAGS